MDGNSTLQYIVERIEAQHESSSKRKDIIIVILILALFFTNFAWICYENSFEDVTTIEQDADTEDGGNILQNVNGSITDGKSKDNNNEN